ncbi:MAG: RHS repeat-associated core domain-containing protein [Amaricoccus sp.]|uniref:RHS repeat-associated core domain-containing protein n=1 Tax=Amaricoccus sp. TaxID=1872485 RepID=UPI0033164B9D
MTVGPIEARGYGAGDETLLTTPQPEVRLSGGQAAYPRRDQVGSIQLVTDAAGADGEHATYQPFGEARTVVAGTIPAETKGFVGERYDAAPELQYLNARYYDPELSLFVSPDWLEVTDPRVGTNRYAYAGNSPVNLSDPGGNCPSCIGGAIGAVAGLVSQAISDISQGSLQSGNWSSPRAYAASAATGALIGGTFGLAAPEALGTRIAMGAVSGELGTDLHSIASSGAMPSVSERLVGIGLGVAFGAALPAPLARPYSIPAGTAETAPLGGLETRGIRPGPRTRVIPEGIPEGWRIRTTWGDGGVQYYNPKNTNENVRVMQGNPNSPYPNSQAPYARQQNAAGTYLRQDGTPSPMPRGGLRDPDAHIPLDYFRVR